MPTLTEESSTASKNHSIIQVRIAAQLLFNLGDKYTPVSETSLDMSTSERQKLLTNLGVTETRELRPDIVLFKAEEFALENGTDKVRVLETPLLCIEIISPTQSSMEILDKFKIYFGMGVKSCWYVDPLSRSILVYRNANESDIFHKCVLFDKTVPIEIPLEKIFY